MNCFLWKFKPRNLSDINYPLSSFVMISSNMYILHNFAFVCMYSVQLNNSTVGMMYTLYRSAYDGGNVQISKIAGGMRVNIGSAMEFDLHELTASDRRSELQHLLVGMGRLIETLQTNLTGSHVFATVYLEL